MRVDCAPALLGTKQFAAAFKFARIAAIAAIVADRKFGPREIPSKNPPVVLKAVSVSALVFKTAGDTARLTVPFAAKSPAWLLPKKLSRFGARLAASSFWLLTKSPLLLLSRWLAAPLFWLLTKSPLLPGAGLLLFWRLTRRLALLLTEAPLRLGALLLLNRRLSTRLLLSRKASLRLHVWLFWLNRRLALFLLLPETPLRLSVGLLLNWRLPRRLTLPLLLTKSPFQLLFFRHLASAIDKPSANGLAPLCAITSAGRLSLGRRLGHYHQGHQCSRRLKHPFNLP